MLTKTIQFWDLTQLVKEQILIEPIHKFIEKNLGGEWSINIFKTNKDEVLQIYSDDTCYTCIGGSSGDKEEWKSNFSFGKLKNFFKRGKKVLAEGYIHRGYYNGSNEVWNDKHLVKRDNMIYGCHSRGAGIAQVIIKRFGGRGVCFGVPKTFWRWVDIDFVNVRNPLDPVVHVVPFFKTVGDVRTVKFCKNPHTKYGDNINKEEAI